MKRSREEMQANAQVSIVDGMSSPYAGTPISLTGPGTGMNDKYPCSALLARSCLVSNVSLRRCLRTLVLVLVLAFASRATALVFQPLFQDQQGCTFYQFQLVASHVMLRLIFERPAFLQISIDRCPRAGRLSNNGKALWFESINARGSSSH